MVLARAGSRSYCIGSSGAGRTTELSEQPMAVQYCSVVYTGQWATAMAYFHWKQRQRMAERKCGVGTSRIFFDKESWCLVVSTIL